jgi:hypothetical protein
VTVWVWDRAVTITTVTVEPLTTAARSRMRRAADSGGSVGASRTPARSGPVGGGGIAAVVSEETGR